MERFIILKNSRLLAVSAPIYETAKVHYEKNRAADNHGNTARQNPERHPAQARRHKQGETVFIFIAEQINARQTADRRQPIYSVILHFLLVFHRRNRLNLNLRVKV